MEINKSAKDEANESAQPIEPARLEEVPELISDVIAELAAFEEWYAQTHPVQFWVLFETYIPETPLVDF